MPIKWRARVAELEAELAKLKRQLSSAKKAKKE